MTTLEIRCAVELRATEDSPGRITGIMLEVGRVASDRPEVFAPGSVRWPTGGIRLLAEHRGREILTFEPVMRGSEIRIDAPLPDTTLGREVAAEIRTGRKRGLSVEFVALDDARVAGVREVRSALVDAAALVKDPAYSRATAEVRAKRGRRWWL